jgi:dTMP kinase
LIKGLQKELTVQGIDFLVTREPGGTKLGEEMRQLVLSCHGEIPAPRTELLLYEAGRAQHVDFVIEPALQKKQWVLCDRYDASSVAFQCGGRGLPIEDVEWLNQFATRGLKPDLYVLLDLTVEESIKRRQHREADRFEKEAEDFHQRVREAYLAIAKREPSRWLILDAAVSPEKLVEQLLQELRAKKWLS